MYPPPPPIQPVNSNLFVQNKKPIVDGDVAGPEIYVVSSVQHIRICIYIMRLDS